MKLIAGIFLIILCALLSYAQNLSAPASVSGGENKTEQTTNPASGAAQTAAPVSAALQESAGSTDAVAATSGETNTIPVPVKDPAKYITARFSFDGNLQPDVGGRSTIPVTFIRESAAYLEGGPVNENSPRFVEGRFGRAVLLESAYANLFSIAQSGAEDISAFKSLQDAVLSTSSDPGFAKGYAEASQPWQGKGSLAVATKGENSEEGFSVEASVEKALYTKESAPAIVPAFYLASLYLKGQGNVKLTLKDVESGTGGEPVYVALSANWQRFSCTFGYAFNRINIGANHDADWKNSIPPGTGLGAKLQLICTTVDSQKLNFFADGLQLEQRNAVSGKNVELSPHSWVLGAFQTAQEQLTIDVKNDYFNTWKKNGSIAFWFKPWWEARDGGAELILQISKNQLSLSHNTQKIIFSPAGVSFTPYDWKNNWHHIVITWNGTGARTLYVDGMDYANASGEVRPIKDADAIMAGDFTKNISPNGAFDELTLYNITLNAEQVNALAAAEPSVKPSELKSSEQSPAPVSSVSTEQKTASNQTPASAAQDVNAKNE